MDLLSAEQQEAETRRSMAQPPLNILFNPSLLMRRDKDIWSISVVGLLDLFLQLLASSGNRDLRICGIAAVSSSMIYRLKVESIFALEKISMQKKVPNNLDGSLPVAQLNAIELPFRFESTYPVTVEDLLQVLEHLITDLAVPRQKKKQVQLEPVETFDFDQYLVKFERTIKGYEDMIFDIVSADGSVLFKSLTSRMDAFEAARSFIAILYLAMKGKVNLEQRPDLEDIRIVLYDSTNSDTRSILGESHLDVRPIEKDENNE